MQVRIQPNLFDVGKELNRFSSGATDLGAVVNFTGHVRSESSDPIDKLVIEHYPEMTEKAILAMVATANDRWNFGDCLIIHRFGEMFPGDPIMMVAVKATHRSAAFQASQFLMDYLKSRAPFWKKEIRRSSAEWVESRIEDEEKLHDWANKSLAD